MKTVKFTYLRKIILTIIGVFSLVLVSCEKEFPNLLKESYSENYQNKSNKVLFITIDGASGDAIRQTAPSNIMQLTTQSVYTFNGLANADLGEVTEAEGWANQLTGVDVNKHNVVSNDFENNNLDEYPSFISLIEESSSSMNTAAFSSSPKFSRYFTSNADIYENFNLNDEEVKNAIIDNLENEDPDIVVGQFHGVQTAGERAGFQLDDSEYADEIMKTDDYIGQIMEALKSRPEYNNEDWLVIITSNKGEELEEEPLGIDPFDDDRRNTFMVIHNTRFNANLIQEPIATEAKYSGYGVKYNYANGNVNAILEDSTLFNIEEDSEYTIQFLMKNRAGTYGWPTILSKRSRGFGGPGWNIFLKGDDYWINSSMSWELGGGTVSDGDWHVVTVVFDREAGVSSTVRLFTDGVFNSEAIIDHTQDEVSNDVPLRIGRIPNDGDVSPDLFLTNLQIYNKALTNDDIASISCITEVNDTHPFYENLIGYWPGNDRDEHILNERTGKMGENADFVMSGPYNWEEFEESSTNLCPIPDDSFYRLVPNSVDLPFQIFQWLETRIDPNWELEGKGWSPQYNDITP